MQICFWKNHCKFCKVMTQHVWWQIQFFNNIFSESCISVQPPTIVETTIWASVSVSHIDKSKHTNTLHEQLVYAQNIEWMVRHYTSVISSLWRRNNRKQNTTYLILRQGITMAVMRQIKDINGQYVLCRWTKLCSNIWSTAENPNLIIFSEHVTRQGLTTTYYWSTLSNKELAPRWKWEAAGSF